MFFSLNALILLGLLGFREIPALMYLFLLLPSCLFYQNDKRERIAYMLLAIIGCFYPIVPFFGGFLVSYVSNRLK